MCFGCVIRNLHNQFSEPVIKKFRVFLQNSLENLSFWGPVFTYFFEKQSLRLTSVFKSSQPLVPVLHRSIPLVRETECHGTLRDQRLPRAGEDRLRLD